MRDAELDIFIEAIGSARGVGDDSVARVGVGIDVGAAIGLLVSEVGDLGLARPKEAQLVRRLTKAQRALDRGSRRQGMNFLEQFNRKVGTFERTGLISSDDASGLIFESDQILGCV